MANSFSQFWSSLSSGLFKKGDDSFLGVDLGSSSVKVIQLRRDKGQAVLETYGELSTGPYSGLSVGQVGKIDTKKLAELMHDLFREANITARQGAMAIPLKSSLITSVDFPKMPEDKIAQMIPMEARKYVPVPVSEVELDWSIIPRKPSDEPEGNQSSVDENNKMEVLIVAIHKDIMKRYQQLASVLGVEVQFLEIETFSAMRSVLRGDLSAMAVVDIGAASTKTVVVDYGAVRLSHTIDKGSQDISASLSRSLGVSFGKAEQIKREVGLLDRDTGQSTASASPIVEYIFSEVNQVMVNYQKKYNRAIDRVVLIGGGALLKGLMPIAEKNVYAPVELGHPFSRVESPDFMEDILKEVGPGFAVSIGLALRGLSD
ncbi:MAG: type IV pilus assembly protein PilM [Patescibacteria group bacterium]